MVRKVSFTLPPGSAYPRVGLFSVSQSPFTGILSPTVRCPCPSPDGPFLGPSPDTFTGPVDPDLWDSVTTNETDTNKGKRVGIINFFKKKYNGPRKSLHYPWSSSQPRCELNLEISLTSLSCTSSWILVFLLGFPFCLLHVPLSVSQVEVGGTGGRSEEVPRRDDGGFPKRETNLFSPVTKHLPLPSPVGELGGDVGVRTLVVTGPRERVPLR